MSRLASAGRKARPLTAAQSCLPSSWTVQPLRCMSAGVLASCECDTLVSCGAEKCSVRVPARRGLMALHYRRSGPTLARKRRKRILL